MKCIIALCLLAVSWNTAYSQKIHFSDTSNRWKVILFNPDGAIGEDYCHLAGNLLNYYGTTSSIREDTIANKVYIITSVYPDYDTSEYLLYDFNLIVGDTLKTRYAHHYISSIDTITVNGTLQKTWLLKGCWKDSAKHFDVLNDYYVIEGIGCLNSPQFPDYPFTFEVGSELVCFENRGIKPTLSHNPSYYFDNTTSCDNSFGLWIHTPHNVINVQIFPNPINELTGVIFPIKFNGIITITNLNGNIITREVVNNTTEINIGRKIELPGVYFYNIIDVSNGKAQNGMLVKY